MPPASSPDPVAVNSMFARIAGRYDLANRLLSGGVDLWWRHRLVAAVRRHEPHSILDLATGSGDVALALARGLPPGTRITGMDFCAPMLVEAERKKARHPIYAEVSFQPGDGLALPLANESVEAVTVSFGLRNMADRAKALGEMRRVLKPRGHLHVLEFSQPVWGLRSVYFLYLKHVLPRIAGWLTRDRHAYDYLCESIRAFPDHGGLSQEILAAGFQSVHARRMTGGIVALHTAQK